MNNVPEYLHDLVVAFEREADPEKAVKMKQYMRNKFDFYGINSPDRKKIYKEFKSTNGLIPEPQKDDIVKWCWNADQREYQMFAMEFLGKTVKKEHEEIIRLYEYMIINKSWWDTIDYIAANLVGIYFSLYHSNIVPFTEKWMSSGNIWLQRTCLLFQLKYKSGLNTELLHSFINRLSGSKEFFIQKAIGWILREYSKTDSEFVTDYVSKNKLPKLSEREALLWMKNKGIVV